MKARLRRNLPDEILKPASAGEIWVSVLGAVLIVVAVNAGAISFLKYHSMNRGPILIRDKWTRLLTAGQPVDWLILGDSSGNSAVLPRVLRARLGASSLNLCTIGWFSAVGDVWMLETYLARFGPPKGVLIVHAFDTWQGDVDKSLLAHVPLPWGFWRKFEPSVALDRGEIFELFLTRYVPLYSQNRTLSDLFHFHWKGFMRRLPLDEAGYMAYEANPDKVEAASKSYLEGIVKKEFQFSVSSQRALKQLTVLAEKYDFDVFLADGPIYEGLYRQKAFFQYVSKVRKTLHSIVSKSRRLHYLSRLSIVFPKGQMESADHVIYSAAMVYTNRICDEIAAQVPGIVSQVRNHTS